MVENRVREGRRRVFKGKREREKEGKRETMTCKDLVIKNHPKSHDREGEKLPGPRSGSQSAINRSPLGGLHI